MNFFGSHRNSLLLQSVPQLICQTNKQNRHFFVPRWPLTIKNARQYSSAGKIVAMPSSFEGYDFAKVCEKKGKKKSFAELGKRMCRDVCYVMWKQRTRRHRARIWESEQADSRLVRPDESRSGVSRVWYIYRQTKMRRSQLCENQWFCRLYLGQLSSLATPRSAPAPPPIRRLFLSLIDRAARRDTPGRHCQLALSDSPVFVSFDNPPWRARHAADAQSATRVCQFNPDPIYLEADRQKGFTLGTSKPRSFLYAS